MDDPTPDAPWPPTDPLLLRGECLLLLRRCEDLLAMIDGASADHGAGLDFARHCVAIRAARRDRAKG